MRESCPACEAELDKPRTQNFCGSCGEPINVEVDRERIRRTTSGFLGSSERMRIVDSVTGDRGSHHEYTHVHAQEAVRHAIWDFWLLSKWEEFSNRDAFLGDIGRRNDKSPNDDDLADVPALLGFSRFFFSSLSLEAIQYLLWWYIKSEVQGEQDIDIEDLEDVEVDICFNGTPAHELLNSKSEL